MMGNKDVKYEDKKLQLFNDVIDDLLNNEESYKDYEHVESIVGLLQKAADEVLTKHKAEPISDEQVSILIETTKIVAPLTRSFYKEMSEMQKLNEDMFIQSMQNVTYTKITSQRAFPKLSWFDDYYLKMGRQFITVDNEIVVPSCKIHNWSAFNEEKLLDKYGRVCFSLELNNNNLFWCTKREVLVDALKFNHDKRYKQFTCVEAMEDADFYALTQDEYHRLIKWLITILASQMIALHTSLLVSDGPHQRLMCKSVSFDSVL